MLDSEGVARAVEGAGRSDDGVLTDSRNCEVPARRQAAVKQRAVEGAVVRRLWASMPRNVLDDIPERVALFRLAPPPLRELEIGVEE